MPSKFQSKHTAEEIENILDNGGSGGGASIEVVEDLPTTGEENTIYVVPGEDKELPNYSVADAGKFLGVDSHGSLNWVLMAGDYLPLSGGTMNYGANINFCGQEQNDGPVKNLITLLWTQSDVTESYPILSLDEVNYVVKVGDANFDYEYNAQNYSLVASGGCSIRTNGLLNVNSPQINLGNIYTTQTKIYGFKEGFVYNNKEEKRYQWFQYLPANAGVYDTLYIGDVPNQGWTSKCNLQITSSLLELRGQTGSSSGSGSLQTYFSSYSIPRTCTFYTRGSSSSQKLTTIDIEDGYIDFFPETNTKLKYHGTEVAVKNQYLYTAVLYNSNSNVFMRLSFVSSTANLLDSTVTSILAEASSGVITGVSGVYNGNPIYNLAQGYIEYVGGSVSAVSLNLELDLVESRYVAIGG